MNSKITELKDTIDLMLSNNHYERLMAEYFQLRIRYMKLEKILNDYENDNLTFALATPPEILKQQLNIMHDYMLILNQRLHIEA